MKEELEIFLDLLKKHDFTCRYGESTRMIVEVNVPLLKAVLNITYTNISTKYEIKYKGVFICEYKIDDEKHIHNTVSNILRDKEEKIKREFFNL